MNSCTLPINRNPSFKFFLHHAFPLAIIENGQTGKNFLFSNYIQLVKSKRNRYLFDIYPRIGSEKSYGMFPNDCILENRILTNEIMHISQNDLIAYIIRWLSEGYYVQVTSDERYIKGVRGAENEKFRCHPAFYFGFDLEKQVLKMLNFNIKGNFGIVDVDFEDVIHSLYSKELQKYLEERNEREFYIQLRQLNEKVLKENFSQEQIYLNVKKGLTEFLNGEDSAKGQRIRHESLKDCVWGMDVYDVFEACFNGNYESDFILQCSCGLEEHKVLMKQRFLFLQDNDCGITNEMIMQMDQIINQATALKFNLLKCSMNNDADSLKMQTEIINKIRNAEISLYEDILKRM